MWALRNTDTVSLKDSLTREDFMALRRIFCLVCGGVCFWMPTTIVEMVTRRELNPALGTFLPPAALLLAYLLFVRRTLGLRNAALWMLAGVSILGPLFMGAAWTALGAGFATLHDRTGFAYLALGCLIPPITLVLAGYDGTLFGVLLATLLMPLAQWQMNRREAHSFGAPTGRKSQVDGAG